MVDWLAWFLSYEYLWTVHSRHFENDDLLILLFNDMILRVVYACHGRSVASVRIVWLRYLYIHAMDVLFCWSSRIPFIQTRPYALAEENSIHIIGIVCWVCHAHGADGWSQRLFSHLWSMVHCLSCLSLFIQVDTLDMRYTTEDGILRSWIRDVILWVVQACRD